MKRVLQHPDKMLTHPGLSKIGAVIGQHNNELWACCGYDGIVLGWTFTDTEPVSASSSRGFWSCIHGCGIRYANPLGMHTSSVLELNEDGKVYGAYALGDWVAGWLVRTDFVVDTWPAK